MTFRKGLWLPSTSYLPEDDRLGLAAFMAPSGSTTSYLTVKSGVIPRGPVSGVGPLQVTASSGMTVNIAPGQMFYQGPSVNQGAYVVTNDATTTVTFDASNPQPRIDVVYVLVTDTNFSGASNNTQPLIAKGTPAGTPTVPTIPTGALALANVTIRASTSSVIGTDIADVRVFTSTLGGPVLCTSGTRPTNPFQSMLIFETDTGFLQMHSGAAWKQVALDGPRGVIAWGSRDTSSSSTTSEVGVLELTASMVVNRFYKIWSSPLVLQSTVAHDTVAARVRYTTNGATPTLSSALLGRAADGEPSFAPGTGVVMLPYRALTTHTWKGWLTCARVGGTGTVSMPVTADSPTIDLVVEDIGGIVSDTGVNLP